MSTQNIEHGDFETFSDEDIGNGLYKYSHAKERGVHCFAYTSSASMRLWTPGMPNPQELFDHLANGGLFAAWNVLFEWHIWNYICVPMYGWPELKLEQCMDTMAQAAAMNLPQGLAHCGEVLGLSEDQAKSKVGKMLIRKLCVPQKPTKKSSEKWCRDPELLRQLGEYCVQDVRAEVTIAKKLRQLSPHEQAVWLATQRINVRGLPVAVDEIRNTVDIVEQEKARLNTELRAITHGEVTSASQATALLAWVNSKVSSPFDDLQGDTVDAALAAKTLPPAVHRVLEIRSHASQTSTAKHEVLLDTVCPDGTVKGLLVYHGAATGRWASRGGLNAQNLPRPSLKELDIDTAHTVMEMGDYGLARALFGDQLMDAAVSTVRGVVKAPAGYEFLDADWSSVENRVGSWIAGQDDKVEMFAKGLDEYKVFASQSLYRIPYEQVTKDQRQVSKSAVLGCMFGQGAKGLVEYAKGYGVELTEERSKSIVDAYRGEYSSIANLWWKCGDLILEAVRNPGLVLDAGKFMKIAVMNNFLWLKLPSGRLISWYKPQAELLDTPWGAKRMGVTAMMVNRITYKWTRQKLIGSSVYQSGVQGTARDLMADALLRLEAAGYPVLLLVHDEFLAAVPEGLGSEKEFMEIMCQAPAWASGLPLAAEAWRGVRFRK